jgi:DNA uptake protein ComE-like DNA-binding protein
MQSGTLRSLSITLAVFTLVATFACSKQDNPDEIRQRTAEATETMRRDTKAVVEGVKEGMARDNKAIDINKCSREDLLTLPGVGERDADRIIAERPFNDSHDLVSRHVVSPTEYDKIQDRVIASH